MDEKRGKRFSVFALLVLSFLFIAVLQANQTHKAVHAVTKTISSAADTVGTAVQGASDSATDAASNATSAVVSNQPGLYPVSKFVDGDTITVDMDGRKETVRLIGVDTPETHKPNSPVQCFGEAAAAFTKAFIGTNSVRLEADPTNQNRDKYGRLLRYVYLPDNRLVNAEIIKQGYGFAYVLFPFEKMDEFRGYETTARTTGTGLWNGSCDVHSEGQKEQTNNL